LQCSCLELNETAPQTTGLPDRAISQVGIPVSTKAGLKARIEGLRKNFIPSFRNRIRLADDQRLEVLRSICHSFYSQASAAMTASRFRPTLPALWVAAAFAFLAAPSAPSASAAEIVALCIGNDHYHKPEDRLDTPVADARLMAETLRSIPGVRAEDVVLLEDGTWESIRTALRRFREKARGARLAIVFFSGHGMEDRPTGYDRAETFLLPVDADIVTAEHLPDRAVGLSFVLEQFRGLPPGGRVVILDCCRTGAPSATQALAAAGKNVSEDLDARVARMLGEAELAEGTMVSFSAGPGRKALAYLQDTDAYSPFTHFLAQGIRERGGNLFDLVSEATATTREATGGRQVPRLRFDGDPSLISAVRIGAARPAPVEESGEVRAMREQLAALERQVEQLRAQGGANDQLRKQVAALEAAVAEAARPGGVEGAPPPAEPATSVPSVPSLPSESPAPGAMARTDPEPPGAFPASSGMEGARAGEVREFGGIEMVWCPPGEFLMGSPEGEEGRFGDERQHRVILTRGFWLAKTETTQGQWYSVMGTDVAELKRTGIGTIGEVTARGADVAMNFVSWDDAQAWLAQMNERHPLPEGWKWELPTEAQWEYACRAGTTTAVYNGPLEIQGQMDVPGLDLIAWYSGNSSVGYTGQGVDASNWPEKQYPGGAAGAREVGLKQANAWGLHDMIGNVNEWCRDWFGYYPTDAVTDPSGPERGGGRVFRGGSWLSSAWMCRSAFRFFARPGDRVSNFGFRPALVPSPSQ